jgi:hypothetical protein
MEVLSFYFVFCILFLHLWLKGVTPQYCKIKKKQTRTKGGRVIQPDLVNGAHPMMPWVFVTCTGESRLGKIKSNKRMI